RRVAGRDGRRHRVVVEDRPDRLGPGERQVRRGRQVDVVRLVRLGRGVPGHVHGERLGRLAGAERDRPARGGEVGPAGGRPARGRQVDRRRLPARGRQGEGERGGGGPAVPLGDAHVADRHRRGRVVVEDRRGPVPHARQGGV